MEKYVIYSEEGEPGEMKVVTATDPEEAKFKYCQAVEIKKEGYLEYVYGEQCRDAFEIDEKGYLWPYSIEESGFKLREGLTEDEVTTIFHQNVRKAFKGKPDYEKLYLDFLTTETIPMEEPEKHVVCEVWGLRECPEDQRRRWSNYYRNTHERWQFPEEMLTILAVAAWGRDMIIKPMKDFEV